MSLKVWRCQQKRPNWCLRKHEDVKVNVKKTSLQSENPHEALHVAADLEVPCQIFNESTSDFPSATSDFLRDPRHCPGQKEVGRKKVRVAKAAPKKMMWHYRPLHMSHLEKFGGQDFFWRHKKLSCCWWRSKKFQHVFDVSFLTDFRRRQRWHWTC
jgi:hypothetical protein